MWSCSEYLFVVDLRRIFDDNVFCGMFVVECDNFFFNVINNCVLVFGFGYIG